MSTCRHRKTWLIGGGYYEWCYSCGALRPMHKVNGGVAPDGRFVRPVGPDGENPWRKFKRKSATPLNTPAAKGEA